MRDFFKVAYRLRAPLFIVIVMALILAVPNQSLEIYRVLAQDFNRETGLLKWREVSFALGGIALVSIAVWLISLDLEQRANAKDEAGARTPSYLLDWMPYILSAIPFFGLGCGLILAQTPPATDELRATLQPVIRDNVALLLNQPALVVAGIADQTLDLILSYNETLRAAAFISFALGAIIPAGLAFLQRSIRPPYVCRTTSALRWFFIAASYVVVAACIASIAVDPVKIPLSLGAIGIVALFFTALLFIAAHLSVWMARLGIPIFIVLTFFALVFSALDINDNHKIREKTVQAATLLTDPAEARPLPSLAAQFQEWLRARPDRETYEAQGKPYPVYIVAAQGGGIYAAFQAAHFLGSIQDECDAFSDHVFAISSVSGGSVGSSVFASLMNSTPRTRGGTGCKRGNASKFRYAEAAERVFKKDLLSPVIGALFFPDLLQRFLFFPVPDFDRARALELSLEGAWDDVHRDLRKEYPDLFGAAQFNPLSNAYLDHWSPGGRSPALLLNATEVETGRRRVIAPFRLTSGSEPRLSVPGPVVHRFALSTSAILSARFPWVTPTGWFSETRASGDETSQGPMRKVRLVDGGFFDNSGVVTALDLIHHIERSATELGFGNHIALNLIILTSEPSDRDPTYGFDEFFGPIRALLNTHSRRAGFAIEQAKREFPPAAQNGGTQNGLSAPLTSARTVSLRNLGYALPLGWRLSAVTRLLVLAQSGDRGKCRPNERFEQTDRQRFDADCVKEIVFQTLDIEAK